MYLYTTILQDDSSPTRKIWGYLELESNHRLNRLVFFGPGTIPGHQCRSGEKAIETCPRTAGERVCQSRCQVFEEPRGANRLGNTFPISILTIPNPQLLLWVFYSIPSVHPLPLGTIWHGARRHDRSVS